MEIIRPSELERITGDFQRVFDAPRDVAAWAPGRVNLLGGHVDYNDGIVMPLTIDRCVYALVRKRADATVNIFSSSFGETLSYPLDDRPEFASSSWAAYVSGVIEELWKRDLLDSGFDCLIAGDIPLGSGLSSSAALEISTILALEGLFAFRMDGLDAALLAQQVEHIYAGVRSGIMDQVASRLGRIDSVLMLDCRSLETRLLPLDLSEVRVVIVDSGVRRKLAESKYNERRAECEEAVRVLNDFVPSISSLRDVGQESLRQAEGGLASNVLRRARHVVSEIERVVAGARALEGSRFEEFGRLMDEAHLSLSDLYEVSCPEIDFITEIGRSTEGVFGNRLTGAGFGGCSVHLMSPKATRGFEYRVRTEYPRAFDAVPSVYVLEHNLEAGRVF